MQTKLAVTDAVTAAALDKRLCTMEEQLHSAHSEAADATSCARGVQQRIAAAEWRIEKVPPKCCLFLYLFMSPSESTLLPNRHQKGAIVHCTRTICYSRGLHWKTDCPK